MSLRQLINTADLAPRRPVPTGYARFASHGDGLGAGCTWRFWVGGASLCVRPAAALHDDEGAWGGPIGP